MCEECGKKLIILSSEEDWRSRCTILVCECGHELTLDGRIFVDTADQEGQTQQQEKTQDKSQKQQEEDQ